MNQDLSAHCRVCLALPDPTELLDLGIVYDEEQQLTFLDCFALCTNINLKDNTNAPRNLCKACGVEMQMAYDFYKKVEEATRLLKQLHAQAEEIQDCDYLLANEVKTDTAQVEELIEPAVQNIKVDLHNDIGTVANAEDEHLILDYEQLEDIEENNAVEMTVEHLDSISEYNESLIDTKLDRDETNAVTEIETVEEHLEMEEYQSIEMLDEDVQELRDLVDSLQTENTAGSTDRQMCNVGTMQLDSLSPQHRKTAISKRRQFSLAQDGPPYVCEHCGHNSPTRALLASHRHRKHRPIVLQHHCPKCNRGFESAQKLDRHMKRPTCETYPEFQCEYCDKKCIGVSNYNIHLRFHKKLYPFVCHICAKRFMMSTHLNTHVKTKHEHQRFICEYPDCGKLFQTSHSLKTHAYTHADTLPYKCDYCLRMYPTKGRLRWHINRSHGIEHTLEDLDSMLVAEKIAIKAELKPIITSDCDDELN